MLYLIIPPVLVVLSLVGIIIFLMRKASVLADIDKQSFDRSQDGKKSKGKFFNKLPSFSWIKPLFLKVSNLFFNWKKSIKKRVEKKEEKFDRERPKVILGEKSEEPKKRTEKKDLFEKILIERIAANPKDIEAYERLGEYYLEIESWDYAKECFKQVIKLNPGSIKARGKMRKLGRILGKE